MFCNFKPIWKIFVALIITEKLFYNIYAYLDSRTTWLAPCPVSVILPSLILRRRIHVSSEFNINFPFIINLIFFNIGLRFGDGDFSYFSHHLDLGLASSNALSYVHLKRSWWIGATNGKWNEDSQSNQDDSDGVDDDAFFNHSRVCVLTKTRNKKRNKLIEASA